MEVISKDMNLEVLARLLQQPQEEGGGYGEVALARAAELRTILCLKDEGKPLGAISELRIYKLCGMVSQADVSIKPTEFQLRIMAQLGYEANGQGSTWAIAQCAFPEKWAKASSRGLLITHIFKAGYRLVESKRIACVLPPRDQWDERVLCGGRGSIDIKAFEAAWPKFKGESA
ncbi:hypothetical protein ACYPKM_00795 [Pseudomonas aeruginosa]